MESGMNNAIEEQLLNSAQLIGLDWGSTGLRAFLMGAEGKVLATRASQSGASSLQAMASYPSILQQFIGDWFDSGDKKLPILACGMIGSKHGWLDVPYVACPANADALAQRFGAIESVHIVPGLIFNSSNPTVPPDLMRGEETQLVGALQLRPELVEQSCFILPGTHSKWAQVKQGQCISFATHMTGELYSVLRQHSVLGRLFPSTPSETNHIAENDAFNQGVRAARDDAHLGLNHQLFAVRSLGVTEKMSGAELANYLSGLLIGHELKAGLNWRRLAGLTQAPLVLIGEPDLCRRYENALAIFDIHNALVLANTAPAGLWNLAKAAKLV